MRGVVAVLAGAAGALAQPNYPEWTIPKEYYSGDEKHPFNHPLPFLDRHDGNLRIPSVPFRIPKIDDNTEPYHREVAQRARGIAVSMFSLSYCSPE